MRGPEAEEQKNKFLVDTLMKTCNCTQYRNNNNNMNMNLYIYNS